jgi:hypothetical protein
MLPLVRHLAAITALLLTAGLLGGCGAAKHAKPGAGSAGTAATPTAPHAGAGGGGGPLSSAQASAYARAVNLSAADLPGFRGAAENHESQTPAQARAKRELAHCTGALGGGGHGVVELSSKTFERKSGVLDLHVSSDVSISSTPAAAAKELAAIRSARVRGCLTRYLDLLFGASKLGRAFSGVSIAHGEPPAPGTTGSFGWRISSAATVRGIRLPFYFDILGFVYGRAQVTLTSSGLIRPFPAAAQQQLYSLLLSRAKSHRI